VRLERQIEKANTRISELESEQEGASFDPERLTTITHELEAQRADKHKLEDDWLRVTLELE
jgi:ATP-binding cassette subfamily F protein uup